MDEHDDDKESYHTNDEMSQEEGIPPGENMETNGDKESSEDDCGDKSSDNSSESSYGEDDTKQEVQKERSTMNKKHR